MSWGRRWLCFLSSCYPQRDRAPDLPLLPQPHCSRGPLACAVRSPTVSPSAPDYGPRSSA